MLRSFLLNKCCQQSDYAKQLLLASSLKMFWNASAQILGRTAVANNANRLQSAGVLINF